MAAGSGSEEEELEDGMRLQFMGAPGKREASGTKASSAGAKVGSMRALPTQGVQVGVTAPGAAALCGCRQLHPAAFSFMVAFFCR